MSHWGCRTGYEFDTPRVAFMRQMLRAEKSAMLRTPNAVALKRLAPNLKPLPERPNPNPTMAFGGGEGFNMPMGRRPFGRTHMPQLESTVPPPPHLTRAFAMETTTALAFRESPVPSEARACFQVSRQFGKPRDHHSECRTPLPPRTSQMQRPHLESMRPHPLPSRAAEFRELIFQKNNIAKNNAAV